MPQFSNNNKYAKRHTIETLAHWAVADKGFKLFRRWISLPVLVSAITFSLAHLILLVSGVEALFMIRMLVFTFALGLIAGYYQEKYDNHAFAIIVHMAGNLMGLVSILMM